MPYVDKQAREELQRRTAKTTGELTYVLSRIVDRYVAARGKRFASLSEAVAALECAKLELYRRVAGPYEDTKLVLNGEVYASAHTQLNDQPRDTASDDAVR